LPVITMTSPKGGCGKSTAALVIATTLARHGASVSLVDCDPSRSLVAWRDGPTTSSVVVKGDVSSTTIARRLRAEAAERQFVIADLAGEASAMVAAAILASDLVIVPTRGSALDAAQAQRAIEYLDDQAAAAGARPFRLLFTCTRPGFATRDERMVRERLVADGVPAFATDLSERAAFRAMFTYRQALEELDPAAVNGLDKAIANADALAGELVEILDGLVEGRLAS
jgi:chromosome partitioning protein